MKTDEYRDLINGIINKNNYPNDAFVLKSWGPPYTIGILNPLDFFIHELELETCSSENEDEVSSGIIIIEKLKNFGFEPAYYKDNYPLIIIPDEENSSCFNRLRQISICEASQSLLRSGNNEANPEVNYIVPSWRGMRFPLDII